MKQWYITISLALIMKVIKDVIVKITTLAEILAMPAKKNGSITR
jgi:hypothetical protein